MDRVVLSGLDVFEESLIFFNNLIFKKMGELTEMRFFFLLEGCSGVDIASDELEIAAKEFVDRMMETCDTEGDYAVLSRTLNYTRIRLQTLYEMYQTGYGAEKKYGVAGMYSYGFVAG